MLLCPFTPKGLFFSLSVFMRVVHHAGCFHLHSFPDFPLTQLTGAIIWQHLLRLWPSEPLSALSPSVSHLRSEIQLPSPFLQYNTLFMSFQMLCGWADITACCLNRSVSHQPRKLNRLPAVPALLEVYVCARAHACFSHTSVSALQLHCPGPTHTVAASGLSGRLPSVPQHF